jgi:hypothetical protein
VHFALVDEEAGGEAAKQGDPVGGPEPEASEPAEEEGEDGPALVVRDDGSFRHDKIWRGAAVAVPVFSLRTHNSVGAGDFADIKTLVDFCDVAGTTPPGHWEAPFHICVCGVGRWCGPLAETSSPNDHI